MIKRVAALPGDVLPGLAVVPPDGAQSDLAVVPAGKLVVLGDNAADSMDSRHFGCCPADRLLGVVVRPLSGAGRNS